MGLEKAKIRALTPGKPEQVLNTIQVMFNPKQYTINSTVDYSEIAEQGEPKEQQFTGGQTATFGAELFFDTSESGSDVRDYTLALEDLLKKSKNATSPPECEFWWNGDEPVFIGYFISLKQEYLMFSSSGTPIRARCTISLKSSKRYWTERKTRSPHPSGGSASSGSAQHQQLWQTAHSTLKSSKKWRQIAESKGIDNPRRSK